MTNIGSVIFYQCGDLVGGRCYPLVAEMTTQKPFICYNRQSYFPETTKDRFVYESGHDVVLNIVTDKYDEGIELLSQVANAFDNLEGEIAGVEVVESKISNITEYYMNNSYVQTVTINIKTN